jgi:hypothetical protein
MATSMSDPLKRRFLLYYDLISHNFTSLKPYVIVRNSHRWDWQKAIQVVKGCPALLELRVTAKDEDEAYVEALKLVLRYVNPWKKKG